MRNNEDEKHSQNDNVLEQLQMCQVFFLNRGDEDCDDEDYYGKFPATRKEFALYNHYCVGDPLILSEDDLRRLGKQLIEMADNSPYTD